MGGSRAPWFVTLGFVLCLLLFYLLGILGPRGDAIVVAAERAAAVVSAFALVFLTYALVEIENAREKQAEAMETARLRIVAGKWLLEEGQVEFVVVNSGWKPSAIEIAKLTLSPELGDEKSHVLQLRRHQVSDGDLGKYNLTVHPGERVTFRGTPQEFRRETASTARAATLELLPVLGVSARADLLDPALPRM